MRSGKKIWSGSGASVSEAFRGRLRDQAILLLTGDVACALSASEPLRQNQCHPRLSDLFFLVPGAAPSFFSRKKEKKDGGAHYAGNVF
ncbi:MAG: hypothetical protein IKI39_02435 [Oscillospiraceae bacterium]|nr:hypothetical protein [Oscillospiraceae bacterium]